MEEPWAKDILPSHPSVAFGTSPSKECLSQQVHPSSPVPNLLKDLPPLRLSSLLWDRLVPGFGEFAGCIELHGSVVLHASAGVKPVSWPRPGTRACTSLGWTIINQDLCATHQGRCQAPKLGQDKGKKSCCTSWGGNQPLKMLRSGAGAVPGHKAGYKARQREANTEALGTGRLAGSWGPPWAAWRPCQPQMPTNLSKAVDHAGRYRGQGWTGDLRPLGAQNPPGYR